MHVIKIFGKNMLFFKINYTYRKKLLIDLGCN